MAVNIIIPIKDTDPEFFEQCLYSLATQTKKSFMVTVVDDASTSENAIKYQKIIDKMPFEVLLHTNFMNKGPGYSRQIAMDLAPQAAEYFTFLDSDDMFYPRTVEIMLHEAKVNDADMIITDVLAEGPHKSLVGAVPTEVIAAWSTGKLYRRKYLEDNDIRFLDHIMYAEDSYFGLVAHNFTKKIFHVPEIFYYWRYNPNSVTRSKDYNFTIKYNLDHFVSQYEGALKILKVKPDWNFGSVMGALYENYQLAKETKNISDLEKMDGMLENWFNNNIIKNNFENTDIIKKAYKVIRLIKADVEFLQTYRSWINEMKEKAYGQ